MIRDDKMPIMEHEVSLTSGDVTAVQIGHCRNRAIVAGSPTTKLAILTLVVFICALVFLFAFLVAPLMYSVNHAPRSHTHEHADEHNKIKGDDHNQEEGQGHKDKIKDLQPLTPSDNQKSTPPAKVNEHGRDH